MIVVDTSALVSVALWESGAPSLVDTMSRADQLAMAAPSYVELGLVLGSRIGEGLVGRLIDESDVRVVDFDQAMAERAIAAWHTFGKGNHPARLNLGDCFTYALAAARGWPILCVGDDFAQTDIPTIRPENDQTEGPS